MTITLKQLKIQTLCRDIKRIEKALAAKAALNAFEGKKKLPENQSRVIEDKNTSKAISEAIVAIVKELKEKYGEFFRTYNLSECRNFIVLMLFRSLLIL